MYLGLWENHRKRLIQEYSPDEGSPIGRLIAEADALEAERETFQKPYTAATEQVRALESAIYKPRRAAIRPCVMHHRILAGECDGIRHHERFND